MIESIRKNSTVYVPEITVKTLSDLVLTAIYEKLDEALYKEIEVGFFEDRHCTIMLKNAILDESSFNNDALEVLMTSSTILYKDPMPCDDIFFGRNVFAIINALAQNLCIEYYNQAEHFTTFWCNGEATELLSVEEDISEKEPYLMISFEI